jgi:hypothetical protein
VLAAALYIDLFERIHHQAVGLKTSSNAQWIGLFSPVLPKAFRDSMINFGLPILSLGAIGFVLLWTRDRDKFLPALLLAWLSTFLYFGNVHSYGPRYLTVTLIPVYILAGASLSTLIDLPNRLARAAVIALTVILSAYSFLSAYPRLEYRSRISGPKDYALWLQKQVPPDSLIIAMDDAIFIRYYTDLRTKPHPVGGMQVMQDWAWGVREILRRGTPVYVIGSAFSYDRTNAFRKTLNARFRLERIASRRTEDYHRAELEFTLYESWLTRVSLRRPLRPPGSGGEDDRDSAATGMRGPEGVRR